MIVIILKLQSDKLSFAPLKECPSKIRLKASPLGLHGHTLLNLLGSCISVAMHSTFRRGFLQWCCFCRSTKKVWHPTLMPCNLLPIMFCISQCGTIQSKFRRSMCAITRSLLQPYRRLAVKPCQAVYRLVTTAEAKQTFHLYLSKILCLIVDPGGGFLLSLWACPRSVFVICVCAGVWGSCTCRVLQIPSADDVIKAQESWRKEIYHCF